LDTSTATVARDVDGALQVSLVAVTNAAVTMPSPNRQRRLGELTKSLPVTVTSTAAYTARA
jgi:hypothetical protein